MHFRDDTDLMRWLTYSKKGQAIVRDVLLGKDGERFMELLKERLIAECDGKVLVKPEPTVALVEVNPKWPMSVRVYGERHLRAKIVELPIVFGGPKAEILADELLPPTYRQVRWPSYVRAEQVLELETVRDRQRRESRAEANMLMVAACNYLETLK